MGSGRSPANFNIPGGGIGSLAPGLSPGMGGPQTQQQAMQALMDSQRSAPAQIPPVGMMGGQMPTPPGPQMGFGGLPPGMQYAGMPGGQMASPGSMFGSMTGQTPNPTQNGFSFMGGQQAVAAPGGVPSNTPPTIGTFPGKSQATRAQGLAALGRGMR